MTVDTSFAMERGPYGLVIKLSGELTFFNSTEIKDNIKKKITEQDERLILELSKLELIDSSGVGVVISLLKKMNGKDVVLVAPKPKIARIFEITRLNQIVPILATMEEIEDL